MAVDRAELEKLIRAADAAGDGAAVNVLFAELDKLSQQSPQAAAKERGFFPSSMSELGSDVLGGLEGGLSMATAIPASMAGGLNFLGTLATTGDVDAAQSVMQDTQGKFTYQPRSDSGQEAMQNIGGVFKKLSDFADRSGDVVNTPRIGAANRAAGDTREYASGSPALATVTRTAVESIPQILFGRAAAKGGNAVVGAAEKALQNYKPGLSRTPEASRMIDSGVDLTPGQMNPGGVANKLEQAALRIPVLDRVIAGARDNARVSWQQSVAQKASAPGAPKITARDINEMVDQAEASYGPLYEKAKGFPVKPVVMNTGKDLPLAGIFRMASKNKSVQADDATRASTESWLMNKLTELKPKPGKQLDSEQLLALRSDVRAQIRKNNRSTSPEDNKSAELMENAERALTKALESQLPKEALLSLKSADAKYAVFKTFQKAVLKAKDNPNGLSPENLSQAVKEGTSEAAYARGGGLLRQEAKDAKATITGTEPMTGAILPSIGIPAAAIAMFPKVGIPAAAAGVALSATNAGRRFARGETAMQKFAKEVATELSRKR